MGGWGTFVKVVFMMVMMKIIMIMIRMIVVIIVIFESLCLGWGRRGP